MEPEEAGEAAWQKALIQEIAATRSVLVKAGNLVLAELRRIHQSLDEIRKEKAAADPFSVQMQPVDPSVVRLIDKMLSGPSFISPMASPALADLIEKMLLESSNVSPAQEKMVLESLLSTADDTMKVRIGPSAITGISKAHGLTPDETVVALTSLAVKGRLKVVEHDSESAIFQLSTD